MDNNTEENYPQGTLSQNSNNNSLEWTPEIKTPARPWGQLVLVCKKIKTLGIKHSYNPADQTSYNFDLYQETCTVGKHNCDITLSTKYFSVDVLNLISRSHFILKRNITESGPVILEDTSHNGTYVNGEKIGRGKTRIIESHDEIALGVKLSKVFIFQDWLVTSQIDIPECIKIVYYISKQIGVGASGTVNLSYNKRNCNKYAIKTVLKDNKIEGQDSLNNPKRIMNEVKIMKKLNHPFVISIHDIVDTPQALYLVMQYMDKGDLQHLIIENKYLSENIAKNIFYQIFEAVKYLHDQNIVHRDLKPQNILLNNCDKYNIIAKVSDFGLSKFIDETYLKTKCGTPLYNAPEVLNNSGGYTEKADIWSLGIMLYFSLSGREPFLRENLETQICNGTYNFNDEIWQMVTEAAKILIKQCVTVDSVNRLSIDNVLEHDWLQDELAVRALLNLPKKTKKQTNTVIKNQPKTANLEEPAGEDIHVKNQDEVIIEKKSFVISEPFTNTERELHNQEEIQPHNLDEKHECQMTAEKTIKENVFIVTNEKSYHIDDLPKSGEINEQFSTEKDNLVHDVSEQKSYTHKVIPTVILDNNQSFLSNKQEFQKISLHDRQTKSLVEYSTMDVVMDDRVLRSN